MASGRHCPSCGFSTGLSGAAVEVADACPQCGATLDGGPPETVLFARPPVPVIEKREPPPTQADWEAATASHVQDEANPPLAEPAEIEQGQVPGQEATKTAGEPQAAGRVLTPEDYSFLAPAEEPGELGRLGKYRILERLGAGGMGTVFRAEDVTLRRAVALKVMTDARSFDPVARARFVREARALATLDSDHVVTVHDVGDDRGVLYLCMALLKGETLQDRMDREKRLPVAMAVRVARQMASGLAVAHEAGLVHRDVKPSNVWLVAGSDQVKLIDFGLARLTDGGAGLTVTRAVMGTPAYMAPEQVRSSKHVDHRADQFALGCVLYEMLIGMNPFRDRGKLGTFRRILEHTPPSPDSLDTAVPPELGALVLRLLQKTPEGRFETTREVVAALDAIAAELGPDAGTTPASTTLVNLKSLFPEAKRPRRRWLYVGIACVVTVAVVAAIIALNRPRDTPPDTAGPPGNQAPPTVTPNAPRKEFENSLGMAMVLIPAGTYTQGSPVGEVGRKPDEGPQREVQITRPFYLGRYEVTVGEFRRFVDATGYRTFAERPGGYAYRLDVDDKGFKAQFGYTWRSPRWEQTDRHPVVCVNWEDAIAFCAWLSRKEGRIYRLASEAEWERAIRGGTNTPFYMGRSLRPEDARTMSSGLLEPAPVGQYPANPFGLHDMIGNVDEWLFDRYESQYREADRMNPGLFRSNAAEAATETRGVRGGSYTWDAMQGRSASRGHPEPPKVPADRTGFRVAAEPIPDELPNADERAVAEILLRNGAILEVSAGNAAATPITRCDDLPAGKIRVTGIELVGLPWVTGEHLAWATRLPGLTHVRLGTSGAEEELAKYVGRLHTLTHLTAGPYRHGDALLTEIANLGKLEELDLTGTSISDVQAIRHLEKLPALKRLTLSGTRIDDVAAVRIAQLKKLTRLQLVDTKITEPGLATLKAALPGCVIETKVDAVP